MYDKVFSHLGVLKVVLIDPSAPRDRASTDCELILQKPKKALVNRALPVDEGLHDQVSLPRHGQALLAVSYRAFAKSRGYSPFFSISGFVQDNPLHAPRFKIGRLMRPAVRRRDSRPGRPIRASVTRLGIKVSRPARTPAICETRSCCAFRYGSRTPAPCR